MPVVVPRPGTTLTPWKMTRAERSPTRLATASYATATTGMVLFCPMTTQGFVPGGWARTSESRSPEQTIDAAMV